MAEKESGPTLTDPIGMGGVIALEGFDYQFWEGLRRVPGWLTNPAFEAIIFEGLEDIEARFFAPHAPKEHLLERLQAKSGSLTPQAVGEVFRRFLSFEKTHPRVARVQTLVTPLLPATLRWVARDAARVRDARPFYAPFASIQAASNEQFSKDLIAAFGEELGGFVAEEVEISEQSMPSRENALRAFGSALDAAFPALDLRARRVDAVFNALDELARHSKGIPLSRATLIATIDKAAETSLVTTRAFPIHIRSDRNNSFEHALEIDGSAFSAVPFPAAERWDAELVAPLKASADWLRRTNVFRISLSGNYRLSTAILIGWTFRSAHGFELEIATKDGTWATDDRPEVHSDRNWEIDQPAALLNETLVVSVGIIRRPSDSLSAGGLSVANILTCFLGQPVTSAKEVQAGVARVKDAIASAVSRLRPKQVALYYAGPAVFAVALGHRWNALPPTTLHEFIAENQSYVSTAILR